MAYSDEMEDALTAVEGMGETGRRALLLAGLMWEELWREAVSRADKAEFLLERAKYRAQAWGVEITSPEVARVWETRFKRDTPVLIAWHDARVHARREEMRELRESVENARAAEEKATKWALRERSRAEVAESECESLMAEIDRLRGIRRENR